MSGNCATGSAPRAITPAIEITTEMTIASRGRWIKTEEIIRRWGPVLERHRVALVLNGHDHNYQRFVSTAGVSYVVTGGGGRQLYPVAPCPAGTPRRVAGVARNHFTAVEVRRRSLTVQAVATDGTVIDRAVIRR